MKPIVGDILRVHKMKGFHKWKFYFEVVAIDTESVKPLNDVQKPYNHYMCSVRPLNRTTQAHLQTRLAYDHSGFLEFDDAEIVHIDLHNRVKIRLNRNQCKTDPNQTNLPRGRTVSDWVKLFGDLRRSLRR
jgi:hypothetical protein